MHSTSGSNNGEQNRRTVMSLSCVRHDPHPYRDPESDRLPASTRNSKLMTYNLAWRQAANFLRIFTAEIISY
jgi:hypothetical protein